LGFPVPASTAVALGRILPVGNGNLPLSFGGFGAMVRHLKRLTGIHEALSTDQLSLQALALLQPISQTLPGCFNGR